jgi:hypothetical protein
MRRKILIAFAFCGLCFATQPSLIAQTSKPTLVGSWEFTAKPNPDPSGTQVAGLMTFTSDGTVVESDTSEVARHATPGHGIWQLGPTPGIWFIRFTSHQANRDGSLHSSRVVTITVTLNSTADQFSGNYSFQTVDPTGHVLTMGSGAVEGQLMVHPLLP